MIKKLISIFLMWLMSANFVVFAQGMGNKIINEEYPASTKVVPIVEDVKKSDDKFLIEGSVEKTVDITLEECLRFALGNNPRIREAMEEMMASDARIGQAWSNYFPTVSWNTGASKNRNLLFSDAIGNQDATYNYFILGGISVTQLLYDFGITQNQATIQRLNYKGSKESLTSVVNDVIKETKDAYYKLLYAYDDKKVAEDNVNKYELFYNQAKAFYEIGMKPKVDVTIAEVNLSNAKLKLIQSENGIDLAVATLNNTMGLPYITKFNVQERLSYQPVDITLEEAINIAKDSRPELKLAEIKVEAARQTVKLAQKAYLPAITVNGGYQVGGRTFTSSYGYGLGANLDFQNINVMLIQKQIKEKRSLQDKALATAEYTRNNIYLEIQKAYLNLVEKKNKLPVAFLGMKQSKENYDLSFGRYKVGEGNPTELKDAQTTYLNSQLSYYQALYEYNSSKATLEKAIGKNLNSLNEVIDLNK